VCFREACGRNWGVVVYWCVLGEAVLVIWGLLVCFRGSCSGNWCFVFCWCILGDAVVVIRVLGL
jgi:hypothetical protein